MSDAAPASRAPGAEEFEPGADPKQWIEQHAGPYRERPVAVLREILQNASDILGKLTGEPRIIEVAILSPPQLGGSGMYHLAVRDSGRGMTEEQFYKEIGILGVSTKKGDISAIGEFGVGFYSTHAICTEVTIISRTQNPSTTTAWTYVQESKKFVRPHADVLKTLLESDFERHPLSSRQRQTGTSVYLALDLTNYPRCEDWLQGGTLAKEIRRDCILLPARVFIADYSTDRTGATILDFHRRDLRDVSLSLEHAPWESDGLDKRGAIEEWYRSRLPYTQSKDYPKETFVFSKAVGGGKVEGFLYLFEGHGDLECVLEANAS
jgi:hypothetical protein